MEFELLKQVKKPNLEHVLAIMSSILSEYGSSEFNFVKGKLCTVTLAAAAAAAAAVQLLFIVRQVGLLKQVDLYRNSFDTNSSTQHFCQCAEQT